jgi:hypothetical protein
MLDPGIGCIGSIEKSKLDADRVLLTIFVDRFLEPLKSVSRVRTATILDVLRDQSRMTPTVISWMKSQLRYFVSESENVSIKFLGQL